MRTLAFGYSTRCNINCAHCVAAGEDTRHKKMELAEAIGSIHRLAAAGVKGISFTAGEPFLYFHDLLKLVKTCRELNIYSRIVTNSYWAKNDETVEDLLGQLKQSGLCQLRLSYSRWHQEHVDRKNIVRAAKGCSDFAIAYFVSFVTDFREADDQYEEFLRENKLRFFPEPLIFAGRAAACERGPICTDFQANRCSMNPYLAPDFSMYACCDAGSHFNTTNFFYLGSLKSESADQLFHKAESDQLYNCIRHMGLSTIASFSGMKGREIVTYRKCELCKKLFDTPGTLAQLQTAAQGDLQKWVK